MRAFLRRRRWLLIGLLVCLAGAIVLTQFPGRVERIDSYAACVEAGYPVLTTEPPICRAGKRNFTGSAKPAAAPSEPPVSAEFQILVDGDTQSQIPAHRQELITSQTQWQTYWRSVHAGLASLPPLIPVNFATSDVVAVSLGSKPTSGYGLRITNISVSKTGSVVSLTESTPTITCSVAQVLTNRYLIVRTTKLTAPVTYRITDERRRC